MGQLGTLGVILGGSWASGINLYLTFAGLGIAGRLGWINLPGSLDIVTHSLVIFIAVILFLVEFFADKVPYVDSIWDSFHTVIRPVGGGVLAYLAMSNTDPAIQFSAALICGAISLDAHLTKATARVAINTSPEPITNSIASVTEDGLVIVALWLIAKHPVVAGILVVAFIVFSIWFLKTMFRFLKKVFRFIVKRKEGQPGCGAGRT